MMSNKRLARAFPLLAMAVALVACSSSDNRSLVLVDLQLGVGVPVPETVHVSASNGGVEVKSGDWAWTPAANGILEVGLFISEGIAGSVAISAKGMTGAAVVAEGSLSDAVEVKPGQKLGPFPLVLGMPVSSGPDGGVGDASVVDGGVSDVAPDLSGSEAESVLDVAEIDGSVHDVALPGDVARDVPLSPDVADGSSMAVETPPGQPDAVDAGETGVASGWQPGKNIEQDIVNRSYYPVVVVEPTTDNVYVAWSEDAAVKVKRLRSGTSTWDAPVVVESRGAPANVTIGADAKGNVLVAWCQSVYNTDDTLQGTWVSRTSDGVSWSPPVRIGALHTWDLQLAVARNGIARVAYAKQGGSGGWPLYVAYYDGTSWTESPDALDPNPYFMYQEPRLVVSESGDGILIYDSSSQDTGDSIVMAVALTGATVGAPVLLNPNYATAGYYDRNIAMNRKGEAIFLWSEGSGSMGLYGKSYSPASGWSSPSPAIATSSSIYSIAGAIDEQGNVTVVWQQPIGSGKMNLVGNHGTLTGKWSGLEVLETDNQAYNYTTEYAFPQMAIDDSGNVLVVWRKDLSTSDTTTYGAFATRYADGAWLPQVELGLKTGLEVPKLSVSVSDSGLGAASFYFRTDDTTTDPDAYNATVALYR